MRRGSVREPSSPSPRNIVVAGIVSAVLIGYVGPVHGYLSQRGELAKEQRALTSMLATRNALHAQLAALGRDEVLEMRARELGLVRPGERAFIMRPPAEPGDGGAATR